MGSTEKQIIDESVKVQDKPSRRVMYIAVIASFLSMMIAVTAGAVAYNAVSDTADKGSDLAAQVKAACDDPQVDTAYLESVGISCGAADEVIESAPSAVPSPSPGPQGDPGEPGTPGQEGKQGEPGPPPTNSQVRRAVAAYCAEQDGCRGKVTPTQVAQAVALYCNERGECRGFRGRRGEQGPPPSDVQVATAVVAYCQAADGCRGPMGPEGQQGPPGPTGVVDINCDAPDGEVIDQVLYNSDTRTVNCTYKQDEPIGGLPEDLP